MTRHDDQPLFTIPGAWEDGHHGLTLFFRHPSDARLASAHHALWSFPEDEGFGWVTLFPPLGSLGAVYPIGDYHWSDGDGLAWRDALDRWPCALAAHVYRTDPFDLALTGCMDDNSEGLPDTPDEVPDPRWVGFLIPTPGGLSWHPPNRGAPCAYEPPLEAAR